MLGAQKSCARAKNGKFVKFHENIRQRNVPGNQNTTKQHQVQFLICPTTLIIPPLVPLSDQNTGPASNVNIIMLHN